MSYLWAFELNQESSFFWTSIAEKTYLKSISPDSTIDNSANVKQNLEFSMLSFQQTPLFQNFPKICIIMGNLHNYGPKKTI